MADPYSAVSQARAYFPGISLLYTSDGKVRLMEMNLDPPLRSGFCSVMPNVNFRQESPIVR
jgi:hypothetical protein